MKTEFTQDDAFELDGCGAQGLKRAVWRRFFRLAPERITKLVNRKRTERENQQRVVEGVLLTDAQEWKQRCLKAEAELGAANLGYHTMIQQLAERNAETERLRAALSSTEQYDRGYEDGQADAGRYVRK